MHYSRLTIEAPPRGTPANIRIYVIFLETTIIGLHFAADNIHFVRQTDDSYYVNS